MRTRDLELFIGCVLVLGIRVGKALVPFFRDDVCETVPLFENENVFFVR